jgi:S1-C subfamily serine protease
MSPLLHRTIWTMCAVASVLTSLSSAVGQDKSTPSLGEQEEAAIRAAVTRVEGAVVQIRTIGGLDEVDRTQLPDGPTTGLVISTDGWILSSAFNFIQQPASILVTLASGEQASAKLVAKDNSRMLVLLKLQGAHELAVPEFVPAAEVRVGEWAIAMGRTYRADRSNISVGVVSAINRMLGKVIQTDAHVSVANYGGPLIDIHGRVVGVIVPMAPQATSEVAGAEWYDSGIGFAVPVSTIQQPIERMKRGEDQYPGILGVSFAAGLAQILPTEIAAVRPNSPAGIAGFRKGDRIVAINGQSIGSQTDLRFALGPRYAGETIQVKAKRGNDELDRTITLAGKLEPFRHAFLGVLPVRAETVAIASSPGKTDAELPKTEVAGTEDADTDGKPATTDATSKASAGQQAQGVVVRMVYPGSPASDADIRVGDRIVHIDDINCDTVAQAVAAMNTYAPGARIGVNLMRNDKPLDVTVTLSQMPTSVPSELPPAYAAPLAGLARTPQLRAAADNQSKLEIRDLKLAEFSETCQVYIPLSHEAGRACGMMLWLHAPGEPPTDELFRQWQSICDRDGLILVAPKAADPSRWERTELEYLRRLIERVVGQYRVDPRRVVIFGKAGGGVLASMLALASRDIVTGVATTDAPLPRTFVIPDNDPAARLAIYAGLPTDESQVVIVRAGLKKLADAGYAVTAVSLANSAASLSTDDREQVARWIDTLDRF